MDVICQGKQNSVVYLKTYIVNNIKSSCRLHHQDAQACWRNFPTAQLSPDVVIIPGRREALPSRKTRPKENLIGTCFQTYVNFFV